MSRRLSDVRRFAIHLHGIDPATQVPPTDILPGRTRRATPYLYSAKEISALMAAAATLRGPHRRATYRTLIGLLAVTGMRVGEAIGLDRDDFDVADGLLTIRSGKFGKSRELPLHPSTVTALGDYLLRGDRPREPPKMPACSSRPLARGCSIATCRTPSSYWSVIAALRRDRQHADPGSMTFGTPLPSIPSWTLIATTAIPPPDLRSCRPISVTSIRAIPTGTLGRPRVVEARQRPARASPRR